MGKTTSISWTDSTWNWLRGCSIHSPSCANCYAMRVGGRFSGPGQAFDGLVRITPKGARWTGVVRIVDKHLLDPLRWRDPARIFCNSVSDPFHELLTFDQIAIGYGIMAACERHTFQNLTKRVARRRAFFRWLEENARLANGGVGVTPAAYCFHAAQTYARIADVPGAKLLARGDVVAAALRAPWPLPNVWEGGSAGTQDEIGVFIGELCATPASVRFLSLEPLIGPIEIGLPGILPKDLGLGYEAVYNRIHWVIAGCESGPGSRPCDVRWLRDLRDECKKWDVPFFLKQANGATCTEWYEGQNGKEPALACRDGSKFKGNGVIELPYLDGVQHAAYPEA